MISIGSPATRTRRIAHAVCFTVLATLFITVSTASANGTTNPTTCGTFVSGKVVLTQDLTCLDSDGLIVAADHTTIYLNGFSIRCMDPAGYKLSCQAGDAGEPGGGEALDFGIDTNGHSNVKVFGPGQIQGFDIGVYVFGGLATGPSASNIDVKRVNVTGPDGDADLSIFSPFPRPNSWAILVQNFVELPSCNDDDDHDHGVKIYQNMVENHAEGIALYNASRVQVYRNFVHDNNDAGDNEFSAVQSHGILVCANTPDNPAPLCQEGVSKDNKIFHNLVVDNGMNVEFDGAPADADGGITIAGNALDNVVANNTVLANNGDGISVRDGAANNKISNNVSLYNTTTTGAIDPITGQPLDARFWDITQRNALVNIFNNNNSCLTESPGVPSTVCNPGESEAWKQQ